MGPHVRARLFTRGLARLVVPMLLAAMFALPLSATTAAHAAFLGKRGVIFVSGRLTRGGETDILSFAFRNGTAVLVQDYTPHDHRLNLSPHRVGRGRAPHLLR